LWVKADKLLPVQNGGNIRTYHVLRYLSAGHDLTFYSYYGGVPDPDYERELQRQLPGAVPSALASANSRERRAASTIWPISAPGLRMRSAVSRTLTSRNSSEPGSASSV